MYDMLTMVLLVAAVALFFLLDSVIDKNTTNETLLFIRTNNQMIAAACLIGAYLAYTEFKKVRPFNIPTYNESINTNDALNF